MGVNEAQALQARSGRSETLKVRDDDLPVISNDYVQYLPPAAGEDACLTVQAARNAGKFPCQLMGDYLLRGDLSPVEPLDIPDITCLQARDIAMNLVYGVAPFKFANALCVACPLCGAQRPHATFGGYTITKLEQGEQCREVKNPPAHTKSGQGQFNAYKQRVGAGSVARNNPLPTSV